MVGLPICIGGYGRHRAGESEDIILAQMRRQAEMAMEAADVILFLTDAKAGLVSADYEVAEYAAADG